MRRPKAFSQAERLAIMLRTLASRQVTPKELADELRISRRQVHRDLRQLQKNGHPVEGPEERRDGTWQLPAGYQCWLAISPSTTLHVSTYASLSRNLGASLMPTILPPLLAELRSQLQALYGVRLRGLYLYGSYARGTADSESDVDVLVVLDDLNQYGQEVNRTSTLISTLSLKYGISISRVFISEKDWIGRQTPFLANVREEAIPA